jgi:hypothetical protein
MITIQSPLIPQHSQARKRRYNGLFMFRCIIRQCSDDGAESEQTDVLNLAE